ncbi:MAG TPA: amidohydrolase family protein [Chryseolinea sp.]|nr:amidohydrolase family protein [Chryseolinea sp.]
MELNSEAGVFFTDVIPASTIGSLDALAAGTKHLNSLGITAWMDPAAGSTEDGMNNPTQTASMLAPYKNSGLSGSQMVDPQKFKQFVIAADRGKLLIHVHAIGDRAVTETLDAIAAARMAHKNSDVPHSITHLQCVQPSDLTRFKDLNVLASMQLLWATADNYTDGLVKPYIQENAYTYMYPAHSIMAHGGMICGASDWPVSSANPFEAIYVAETRKGENGVLNPSEIMSRKDMLQAYTLHAARAILREKEIGSLDVGKQADLIVLDRDVLNGSSDSIRNTKVLWTMVNGKIVYQRSP